MLVQWKLLLTRRKCISPGVGAELRGIFPTLLRFEACSEDENPHRNDHTH
jgi:hypothetical protein